jgi:hypothetical protein
MRRLLISPHRADDLKTRHPSRCARRVDRNRPTREVRDELDSAGPRGANDPRVGIRELSRVCCSSQRHRSSNNRGRTVEADRDSESVTRTSAQRSRKRCGTDSDPRRCTRLAAYDVSFPRRVVRDECLARKGRLREIPGVDRLLQFAACPLSRRTTRCHAGSRIGRAPGRRAVLSNNRISAAQGACRYARRRRTEVCPRCASDSLWLDCSSKINPSQIDSREILNGLLAGSAHRSGGTHRTTACAEEHHTRHYQRSTHAFTPARHRRRTARAVQFAHCCVVA